MITKQRLEELIKEKAKVYYTQNHPLVSDGMWIDLTRAEIIPSQECIALDYKIYGNYGYVNCFPFKWLYETKEDAEEYLKYGNITREEKLELPLWSEVKEKEITVDFNAKHAHYRLYRIGGIIGIIEFKDDTGAGIFNEPFTRENYDKARDLCVKLFMEEEE